MPSDLEQRIINHLNLIYPDNDNQALSREILSVFFPTTGVSKLKETHLPQDRELWSEQTAFLITYGNSLIEKETPTLQTLHKFLTQRVENKIPCVHILPFFPYSSDEGFAVIDYKEVREELGTWEDIEKIGNDFHLMSDMVINHASSKNVWFKKYLGGVEEYQDFFFTASPDDDLNDVVRPRPFPLLTCFDAHEGLKYVWCTFGPDQVDFNFSNPAVLLKFIELLKFYLDHNIRIFRLDAVAFLWKVVGTSCIHLPQTHEIIRLFRTLIDFYDDDVLIITETNVPNEENLTYFGNQNETHMIYNFSLPPILLHALLSGDVQYLKKWLTSLPTPQSGCTYFNFTASHDGIGLRPVTGLLEDSEVDKMIETVRSFGGEISMRAVNGGEKPYEMNIALFDAMKGTMKGEDDLQIPRFLASQTIMMALQGVPAFYIHSLLGTPNAYQRYQKSGHKRCINRRRWNYEELEKLLDDPSSHHHVVFNELKRLIEIRTGRKAFHPHAAQYILNLPEGFLGFWRQSPDRKKNIYCITNMKDKSTDLPLHQIHFEADHILTDLISGEKFENREATITVEPYRTLWLSD
jgi:sucrose phosphorylase